MKLKKLTVMLLAVTMTFYAVNVVFAEENVENTKVEAMNTSKVSDTDVKYEVEDGYIYFDESTGTITGADEYITSATIPTKIYGETVKYIGNSAFLNCGYLKNITIPNSVVGIGDGAFDCCISLNNITIPHSVTSIRYCQDSAKHFL